MLNKNTLGITVKSNRSHEMVEEKQKLEFGSNEKFDSKRTKEALTYLASKELAPVSYIIHCYTFHVFANLIKMKIEKNPKDTTLGVIAMLLWQYAFYFVDWHPDFTR